MNETHSSKHYFNEKPRNWLLARLLNSVTPGNSFLLDTKSIASTVSSDYLSLISDVINTVIHVQASQSQEATNRGPSRVPPTKEPDRMRVPWGGDGNRMLGSLTPADRHGSVQVVSSTNGELNVDDPGAGTSNTPLPGVVDVDVVSETKCCCFYRKKKKRNQVQRRT